MPLYYYRCPKCDNSTRRLLNPDVVADTVVTCHKCGEKCERLSKPATVKITETLDNGIMVRRLERIADAEQIHRERAHGRKGVI